MQSLFEVDIIFKSETSTLKCSNLIIGPEFRASITSLLTTSDILSGAQLSRLNSLKPETNTPEKLSRFTLIFQIPKSDEEKITASLPFLAIIPEKTIEVKNEAGTQIYTHEHPISIFVTGKCTCSCPEGFLLVYLRLKEDLTLNEEIRKSICSEIEGYLVELLEISEAKNLLSFYHTNEIVTKETEVLKFVEDDVVDGKIFLGFLQFFIFFEGNQGGRIF
jgi:hypothetical protein